MSGSKTAKKNKDEFESFVKTSLILIAAGSILAAIKCVFVGLQRDEEYAITLAYRMLQGDRMLLQIWDPHQTSAYLLAFIEWIYIKITGGTVGIVLWCKAVGTIIHGLIAFYFYRILKRYTSRRISFVLGLIYFGILPKNGVIPEFSLMMAWLVTLIVIVLLKMYSYGDGKQDGKKIYLSVLLSLLSFALVLAYPSCIIMIPFIYALLLRDRKRNPKLIPVLYPVLLIVFFALFLGYLLSYMSPDTLLFNVREALKANGAHDIKDNLKLRLIIQSIIAFGIITGVAAALSIAIVKIKDAVSKDSSEKGQPEDWKSVAKRICMTAIILGTFAQVFFCMFHIFEYLYSYELCYLFWIMGLAAGILILRRREGNNHLFLRFLSLNILGFLAIMLLTNLTIFTSVPYCISGIIISLLTIVTYAEKQSKKVYQTAIVMLLMIAFGMNLFKGIKYNSNDGYNWNIRVADKVIQNGPAKGIFVDYMTGTINENAQEDWNKYIKDNDTVLVWDVTSLYYLNKNVGIGSYTTISTPTYYVDSLKTYWEENPDKYPDVIAVADWFGNDFRMTDYDHFLDWIENEYGADEVHQENYYRYYIRRR